jgi:hypothetical protein
MVPRITLPMNGSARMADTGTRRAAAPEGKGIRCDGIPFPNTSDVYDVDEVIRRYARAAGEL